MIDLYGSYTHNVDAKGRLSLPAKFRKKIPEDLIVSINLSGDGLNVFDKEGFDGWVASIFEAKGGFNALSKSDNAMMRELRGRAEDVTVDSAGRIIIPAKYREPLGLDKEVTLVGNMGYFEIWNAKRREEESESMDLSMFMVD